MDQCFTGFGLVVLRVIIGMYSVEMLITPLIIGTHQVLSLPECKTNNAPFVYRRLEGEV